MNSDFPFKWQIMSKYNIHYLLLLGNRLDLGDQKGMEQNQISKKREEQGCMHSVWNKDGQYAYKMIGHNNHT